MNVFFPIKILENFKTFRDHIRTYVKESILFMGVPDSKKQWESFIEEYTLMLGKIIIYEDDLNITRLFEFIFYCVFLWILEN